MAVPGSNTLIAGNNETGFYGEINTNEMPTNSEMAQIVGLSSTLQRFPQDTNWLKFSLDGKVILTPKIPILESVSWNALNEANAVFGERIISINGEDYKIRLFKGANTNPSNFLSVDRSTANSEWNRLILSVAQKSWTNENFAIGALDWGIDYPHRDLRAQDNEYNLCQETAMNYASNTHIVIRGPDRQLERSSVYDPRDPYFGVWRPVLEWVGGFDINAKVNGETREADKIWAKVGGQLREVDKVWAKVNNALREV